MASTIIRHKKHILRLRDINGVGIRPAQQLLLRRHHQPAGMVGHAIIPLKPVALYLPAAAVKRKAGLEKGELLF